MSGTRKETVVYDPSQGTGHYEPAPHCQLIEPASLVVVEMNDSCVARKALTILCLSSA